MNPILAGYVADFIDSYGLKAEDQGANFERFANHCVIARDFPSVSNPIDIVVGGGEDTGLDGVAVFVNGIHVEDENAVDFLASKSQIDVDFVFIQSKSSKRVQAKDVGSFCEGVYSFFQTTGMKENDEIAILKKLKDFIFSKSAKFSRRPDIYLYFCTGSNFGGDQNVNARANSGLDRLENLNLFREKDFQFLNSQKLTTRYDEIRLKISREVLFERHAVFPDIDKVHQAYIGLISCEELLKLITNSDGEIQRNIFSENIRDYLGRNKVNREIERTLRDKTEKFSFPVLNNGITVVAKKINSVGNKFTLSDYQIVNGCQTSNIIYQNRHLVDARVYVPTRFIEASDRDIINDIVRSTNSQTQITDEAFVALDSFHKELEKFFNTVPTPPGDKIFYERRRNQYSDADIPARKVISLTLLIKSFVAVFLGEPHSQHRYYGELMEAKRDNIFNSKHSLWAYYTAAAIYHKVDNFMYGNTPKKHLRKYKHQICFVFIKRFGKLPDIRDQVGMDKFCNRVLKALWDEEQFKKAMKDCITILESALIQAGQYRSNPPYRRRDFTQTLDQTTHPFSTPR